jgi:hypothetical protein
VGSVLDELDKPNLNITELWEFLFYDEELPVTLRQLKNAALDGELVPTKLSGNNYYSRRQGLDWVTSRQGKYRKDSKLAKPVERAG